MRKTIILAVCLITATSFAFAQKNQTFYDKNGQTMRTTHYKNDKKEGTELYFTPSGEVFREITFKADRIVSDKTDSTLLK